MKKPFVFSKRSRQALQGVDAKLVSVVTLALDLSDVDFMVIEGKRTVQRQRQLFEQGRSKPGPIVTWTMNSKHVHGLAVDLLPAPYDWKDLKHFDAVAEAMFAAADLLGVRIRWGADWNSNGEERERGESDSPHFELV